MLGILLPSFNESKNIKIFLEVVPTLRFPKCVWNKPHLFTFARILPICNNIFIIIDQCRFFFFTSGIGPGNMINVLEDCIMFLIWTAWVLFNFYLKQKKKKERDFQSVALLKMPPSSPSMEEFCLDIQKYISLKQRLSFPKITKTH